MNFHKARILPAVFAIVALLFAGSAASAKTFKMAIGDAQGGTQWALAEKFSELFTEKTGGKHKVSLFPNGQLGSEQDTINDAAMGTLDFSLLAVNNITPFSPTVGVLTLPYVILGLDDAVTLTHGEVGKELVENTIRDAGVRIIGWAYSGFRVLTNSKKPVATLDDLKGLIIRVPKNEIMIATYQAWGCNPTPMAWSETFTALQQKVVDGQDNPFITVSAMKFYEVQKYITTIRYIFSLEPLVISEAVFQDLKPELQKAVLDAGQEATLYSEQYLKDSEAAIIKDLEAKGMEISAPADDEKEWIEAATSAVWPKYYDSIGGKDKFDSIMKVLGR
ncbi:TRAP transporter substrate-binding protein [Desulforhopalus singaporensis]|uniref:Tripartite ATP-independent transporter solute receptor, DctP family n=1 Tax=Desulforhopalus singaporensis TaxID=91360 RepID=A0A1H0JX67_9BACT|nr:TRAP transporter substrate-binding protein [Desulforhopalus singaporensis]SDO48276.1 tripartite ATP-independent transporter solute receptor, DctP family [Desulforhopalus singaporensis]